jgi:hypothetical protein
MCNGNTMAQLTLIIQPYLLIGGIYDRKSPRNFRTSSEPPLAISGPDRWLHSQIAIHARRG